MKIIYNQNPHQNAFHNDDESKILLLTSGFGAGKSHALVMKLLKLTHLNAGLDGGLVCPSIPDYKKDMLPLIEGILNENKIQYRYHQTDKWFSFPWSRGRLYVASAEKTIRGSNWAFAGINEVGLIAYERFKEVIGRVRMRNAKRPQIICVGTPEGKMNWVYDHFVDRPRDGTSVIYGNTRDNKALHPDYIKSLMDNYDEKMLQAYLEGKFVNLSGALFYYCFTREKNCDRKLERIPNAPISISIDFNVDNMTSVIWHRTQTSKGWEAWAFDEMVLKNSNTDELCRALKARGYGTENSIVYPDPAGNARKTSGIADVLVLKGHGYRVKYKPRAPTFRDRQLCVNNLLDKGLLKIHPDKCPRLLRDLESVEQSKIDFSKNKENSELSHASDSMDYFIDIEFPLSGRKPVTTSSRF